MAKADVISGGMSQFQATQQKGLQDFLASFYDDVQKDVGGGNTASDSVSSAQEATDIQNAVAAAKAVSDQAIQALQTKFDNLGAKEQKELQGITDLKMQFQKVQDAVSNLLGLMPAQAATDENAAAGTITGAGGGAPAAGAATGTPDASGKASDQTPQRNANLGNKPGPRDRRCRWRLRPDPVPAVNSEAVAPGIRGNLLVIRSIFASCI
jgi:hypothetical protein